MATITKRGEKWRAQVRIKGISKSATFRTHTDAKSWAARMEAAILDGVENVSAKYLTFGDIAERYLNEVTPKKRGAKHETYRIKLLLRNSKLADVLLENLRPSHFADWRDKRLTEVKPDSVLREISSLSAICDHAMKEWGLLKENPLLKISKPKQAKPRTRRPTEAEIQSICENLGYVEDIPVTTVSERAALAFLFAIETAMRAGEICALTWDDIDESRRLAHIKISKNGHSRDVPLSRRAIEIISKLKNNHPVEVFNIQAASLDSLFRRARDAAGIKDLHFHDSRREALTRMAKKVDVMLLAKISGHRDIRILQNTYYAPDMAGVADLLD
ncbi:integrase [Neisseria arctica]|uniref:Integrase n=1 Tax=Neisseria arctica TaxID=1470200 RepID=A0A0J0YSZ4_9NEIS|nr:site-specific integrase [Neisseria arctica]KLT73234.1 integrase [Neisseria arctica]UOO87520.1 site-specific integrase [Neisseria arctica]